MIKVFLKNLQILKSGLLQKKSFVLCFETLLTMALIQFLWHQGFIAGVKVIYLKSKFKLSRKKFFLVFLKNLKFYSPVKHMELISTADKPVFSNWFYLTKFFRKNEIILLSTSLGLLTQKQCLRLRIGGKVLMVIN